MAPMILFIAVSLFGYVCWFQYSSKYHTLQKQVPWRRAVIKIAMVFDRFIFETVFGMNRKCHFSLCTENREGDDNLKLYENKGGHCWCFGPHHLIFPGFMVPFYYEANGVHTKMGVEVDEIFSAAATVLFYIAGIREIIMTLGGRIASPDVLASMKTFGVAPGGIHEMIRQSENIDRLYLRTGFLRFSWKKKLDIVPGYLFDENECYKPLYINDFCSKIQKFIHKKCGIGLCFWKGRWNIPFNPIPYSGEYLIGIGKPIKYENYKHLNEDKAVEELMISYQNEVKRLFMELQKETQRRQHVKLEIHVLQTRSKRSEVKKEN